MADRREPPNVELLDQVAEDFAGEREVVLGTMFRNPGLRVGSKIFAFLGNGGELVVKLPRERALALVAAGTAEELVMGKRTMREWVTLPPQPDTAATLALWRGIAQEAHHYVDSLR